MVENKLKSNIWNEAAKAGLVLGITSSAYLFMNNYLGTLDVNPILLTFFNITLRVVKIALCVFIMVALMKKFINDNPDATNNDTRKLGSLAALLSAFIFAGVSFADIAYISPDLYAEQQKMIMDIYSQTLDANMLAGIEKTMRYMPQYTFFTTLIYCYLYGSVLSAILSRNIPSRNPFADNKTEQN